MHNNKKICYLINVISLLIFSSAATASDGATANAGSWVSILPPVLTIAFALVFKRVIPALFLGIWLGAWAINGFDLAGLWSGLLDSFQVYVLNALSDSDHASIILFSMMIGGMVGIISRNGGMQAIVDHLARWADNARHAALATASMGLAIFFDDYANTLVVGNTMRPLTDSMRISRAKLAYIVDSTAAPVASIALVSTWIGYEVGLIGDAIAKTPGLDGEAYLVFLNTVPYRFYSVLAIAFVFMIAAFGRDFGPMLQAERRAKRDHRTVDSPEASDQGDVAEIKPVDGKPRRALNAALPVGVMVIAVIVSLYLTGYNALGDMDNPGLRDIIGAADSYKALMWSSLLGALTAVTMTLTQRILDLEEIVNSWLQGARSMFLALIILVLAWSLGEITTILHTADFLTSTLGQALPPFILPGIVFVIAAATAFATGSSWGAMGILLPLSIPLTWAVMQANGQANVHDMHLLYASIASVLAGSVWGDHCSPISDTTVLSSLASGCDHIEHVRTQLPYAMLVGLVSVFVGGLPTALGAPWWLGMSLGLIVLWLILRFYGKPSALPQGD